MEELDLKQLISLFWEKKIYIIGITLCFIIVGACYSFLYVEPEYQSYTSLLLAKNNDAPETTQPQGANGITQTEVVLNQKLISTYSELIRSKIVLREVLTNLQIEGASDDLKSVTEDSLRKKVSVAFVKDTELIKITVKNANPEVAKDIANELAKVFIKKVNEMYNMNNVHIIDVAEVETTPSNINHAKDIVIFAFIGVAVAFMVVLVSNMLNTTIRTVEDIEKLKLQVLGEIPKYNISLEKGGVK